MTSINLVSPVGNGHTYTVRFREPLVIEPNSKVYLNFAKFKRNNSIYFSEDQTLKIILTEVLPSLVPGATGTSNLVMAGGKDTITIPEINPITNQSGYTAKELEQVIADRLGGAANDALDYGVRAVGRPATSTTQMFLYSPAKQRPQDSAISVGWYKSYNTLDLTSWDGLSTTHVLGMGEAVGDACVKTSADSTDIFYDCFGLSKQTFDFSFQSQLGNLANENSNLLAFTTNTVVESQVGNVFIGFSSQEIADSVAATDWTDYVDGTSNNSFTHGTTATQTTGSGRTIYNPVIYEGKDTTAKDAIQTTVTGADLKKAVPQCFLGIELTGSSAEAGNVHHLNIWQGVNKGAANDSPLTRPAKEINRMRLRHTLPLATVLNGADATQTKISLAIQTYWEEGFSAKKTDRMGYRVFNQTNSNVLDKTNCLFDSLNTPYFKGFVKHNFFKQDGLTTMTTGTAAQKAQKANSQVPFNVIMSAQSQNEGFSKVGMTGFQKTGADSPLGVGTNDQPITLVQQYQLQASAQLARFLGTTTTENFNPNLPLDQAQLIKQEVSDQTNDESYSIFLKNLPIRAFKNIQSKEMSDGGNVQSAGYAQPIIHDVPAPYSESTVINNGSGALVVGTFLPSIKKVLDLDNNRQVLNSIDVEIRDIETNEISSGLAGSVINFTIEKPSQMSAGY